MDATRVTTALRQLQTLGPSREPDLQKPVPTWPAAIESARGPTAADPEANGHRDALSGAAYLRQISHPPCVPVAVAVAAVMWPIAKASAAR